jgi:hypothetical protein
MVAGTWLLSGERGLGRPAQARQQQNGQHKGDGFQKKNLQGHGSEHAWSEAKQGPAQGFVTWKRAPARAVRSLLPPYRGYSKVI